MKKFLLVVTLFISVFSVKAQTLSYDDFKSLVPYLKEENWGEAFKRSSVLLQSASKDTFDFKAVIVYINIFSAAGMVSEGNMNYTELEQNVMKYEGQKILMSAHPVSSKDGALRQTKFTTTDSTNEAFTSATNAKGTNILCFEHFYLPKSFNPYEFSDGDIVRMGGVLQKIEMNPNKSKVWILRLTIGNAFVQRAG